MLQFDFFQLEGSEPGHSAIVFLCGRFGNGKWGAKEYRHMLECFNKTTILGVTPYNDRGMVEWYPAPNSSIDQDDAVNGQSHARERIERILSIVEQIYKVPRSRTILAGFSAGAVMSVYTNANNEKEPLGGILSHAGAILRPDQLPAANEHNINTPILLMHGRKDHCFDWYERYVPMKNALIDKGYPVSVVEHFGYHQMYDIEIIMAGLFMHKVLGYEKFTDIYDDDINEYGLTVEDAQKEEIPLKEYMRLGIATDEQKRAYYAELEERHKAFRAKEEEDEELVSVKEDA